MYLFFDTETTGLPRRWKAPVTDLNNWPRMVQLACLLFDSDARLVASKNLIVRPDAFTIPQQVSALHGITTEKAMREGVELRRVLLEFEEMVNQADLLVAHNMSFDEKIVGAEFLRQSMRNCISAKKKLCTMELTTDFCAIPGPYGYKWPKLSELHYKLFQCHFEEAHNAAVDITITAKCFWELKRLGAMKKMPAI